MVLQRGDAGDERRRLGREGLPAELERVAEPLAGDPQLVEGLDVGPAEDRLVRPDGLVRGEDLRPGGVADAVRLGRGDRNDRESLVADELAVVVDPASVVVGVELADQQLAGVVAVGPPAGEERLERALLGRSRARPGTRPRRRAARRGREPRRGGRRSRAARSGRPSSGAAGTRRRTPARRLAAGAWRRACRGDPRGRSRRACPLPWRASARGGTAGPCGRPRRRGRRGARPASDRPTSFGPAGSSGAVVATSASAVRVAGVTARVAPSAASAAASASGRWLLGGFGLAVSASGRRGCGCHLGRNGLVLLDPHLWIGQQRRGAPAALRRSWP